MDIKNIYGIKQSYGQTRLTRGESGTTPAVGTGSGTDASQAASSDRVTLSDNARLVAQAATEALGTSDVRADKVASLKAQVQSGTYQPDSKKIAEKLLTMESDLFG
ncbi:MAG: flagellar biosynthesis anti-sigma factor FlgM [Desulfovibrionaceae bacterium]|jgi:negative regulator of flagellin synthesis FlgM